MLQITSNCTFSNLETISNCNLEPIKISNSKITLDNFTLTDFLTGYQVG
jgi:hypothetical protein